ncbi:MAG: squalene/phytoene synthase family protein [Anaerolineales bacterium]|nr:squalene/phytoene synthase family protein [Anaerolineales bacterium]
MSMNLVVDPVFNARNQRLPADVSHILASSITQASSKQSYYTVRCLVDRTRIDDAYRAYAYFRWVDDNLDETRQNKESRIAFANQQTALINHCYHGNWPQRILPEEQMLVNLIRRNNEQSSGLRIYIENMMAVMQFDAERKGRLISQSELDNYAYLLATAVTEALHYFIGNGRYAPGNETRYLAATGAHIAHMLRDTVLDVANGYYNIPGEYLAAHNLQPWDIGSEAYRMWVKQRVELARTYFQTGKQYLAQVEHTRCRIAGYAYIARFETVLDLIEKDNYFLRVDYPERKRASAFLKMGWSALTGALNPFPKPAARHTPLVPKPTIQW